MTLGIRPGDAVLVIEHRGEQQIVYHALCAGISMSGELRGTSGEPAIEAAFIGEASITTWEMKEVHATLSVPGVVHISHRDWIERRASLGYEELPGPIAGMCRYCRCTERRACAGGCAWLDSARTVCSNPACGESWVKDNRLRQREGVDSCEARGTRDEGRGKP
jgi:hypothetical protein